MVIQITLAKFQAHRSTGWFAIEVAGIEPLEMRPGLVRGTRRRERPFIVEGVMLGHRPEPRDQEEPRNLRIGEEMVEKQARQSRGRCSEIRNDASMPSS